MTEIWQSPAWPRFSYDPTKTETPLAVAAQTIGEIQGLMAGLDDADRRDLQLAQIVKEVVASFNIEGVTLDPTEIEASVIASLKHRTDHALGRRSDAIVELMLKARNFTEILTPETLMEWHKLLFFNIEIEDLGKWRSFDIEIIRSPIAGKNDVMYRAVPAAQVATEMARFLAWFNHSDDTPQLIRAALAHLWFESIHPFSDGNGRIGRALIETHFAADGSLPFSFSRQIKRDKKAYYDALQAGRQSKGDKIDATAFVTWFLDTIARAATLARDEAAFILWRNRFFITHQAALNLRQIKALRALFDQGPTRIAQGINAKTYRKITKTSPATATRDLIALETAGILARRPQGGRSTIYDLAEGNFPIPDEG